MLWCARNVRRARSKRAGVIVVNILQPQASEAVVAEVQPVRDPCVYDDWGNDWTTRTTTKSKEKTIATHRGPKSSSTTAMSRTSRLATGR